MSSVVSPRVLPGFSLSLGYTLSYLSLIVLIPLAACAFKASGLSWEAFVRAVSVLVGGMRRGVVARDAVPELAAAALGASRWQAFRWVVFPAVLPAVWPGFTLAFARGLGEYGSVVFVAASIPNETQIAPVL